MSETTTYNRETLLEILHARETTVKFRKANHDLRVMRCTLKFDLLPEKVQNQLVAKEKEKDPDAIVNEEVVTVFDLEQQDWRSFRVDRILEVL